jgi:outer membrane protein assembly factor BamB
MQGSSLVVDRGKIGLDAQNRHWMCFDGRTGKVLWTSELTEYPWGNWWAYSTSSYDFNESKGAIIACSYAGLYAFDWDNGKILWHYASPMAPFESPYGQEPFFTGVSIADGKVYVYGGEHTTTEPITRGWHLHCVNATTGEGIWKMTGPMTPGAIADGYLTASNPYDGYMYVFGKGKSKTTVEAPDVAVPKGTAVLIHGTVMDMSPGDQGSFQNPTAPLDSPTKPGTVPCVSKDSMQTQMEYLYMQHPIDGLWHNETITGVPVTLTAIKSDGTVIDVGSTTTNGYYGTFTQAWTPPDEGTYTIMASFAGDDSYGISSGATGLTVGPAPAPYPTPPEAPTPIDYTALLYGILIAVIIAIVLALVLIFRPK